MNNIFILIINSLYIISPYYCLFYKRAVMINLDYHHL